MRYDVTNNTSIIQLAPAKEVVETGNVKAIELPSSVPSPELIQKDNVPSGGGFIELPSVVPSPQLLPVESVVQEKETIAIPAKIPSDPLVLLESVPLPSAGKLVTGDKYYIHLQSTPSTMWEVYHNLGKRPAIFIEDSTGKQIITEIVHVTDNVANIFFGKPYRGIAYCN